MVAEAARENGTAIAVEFLGHAAAVVHVGHLKLLCDPHLFEDFRAGLFGYFPARDIDRSALPRVDAIILSHSHRDHFDLRSLNALERRTPVFCPLDFRIQYALARLGFLEVVVVDDWTHLKLEDGIELLWTPSTYRVPEHGLAMKAGGRCMWNLVDTHVTVEWGRSILERLAVDRIDALLVPCQPLLETEIVEGVQPIVPRGRTRDAETVVEVTRPRMVAPFADGHYCNGRAAWMNHQKFPFSRARIESMLKEHGAEEIAWPGPGDRLVIPERGAVRIEQEIVGYVRSLRVAQERSFEPGGWVSSLAVSSEEMTTSAKHLDEMVSRGLNPSEAPLSRPLMEIMGLPALSTCTYRILVIGADGTPVRSRGVRVNGEGRLNPAEEQSADVEVAIAAPDLAALIDGRLGFSALLLCGMVRELRPGLATRPDAFVVTSIHDTPPAGREEAILSGACLINLLLNRWRPDLATREMDVEIESCELERPLWRCPEETLDTQAWSARLPSCASYLDRAIWVDVAEAIWKHGDASAASGVRRWRDEVRYLAFPGLRPWISPGEVAVSGLSGTLVVSNFIEAQPHMGAGVRFPEEAYRRLLENVASSGIDRWAVIRAVPPGSSVPAWRFASLLPFTAERLRMDLTSRGWRGVLDDVVEGEGEMEPAWWLGVPPLGTDFPANEVMFESPSGEALPGLLYAARAVRRPPSGGFTPAFRLRLAPGYEATAVSLLRCLAEGGLRFSWLLSVHDTEELYPSARKLGCARWIQEVAVGCLRQSLELA